jgi:16S rRNA (guanine527-N7)-methyltransferase
MSPMAALVAGLDELRLTLRVEQRERLLTYIRLLAKWNAIYNLTAIRDEREMVSHHLLDSLAIVPHLHGPRLVDVGSGAGLPGVPVAIARPDWEVTLVDSNQKRTAFLHQAVVDLALANTRIESARVEAWQPDARFDVVVSRAFAELGEFAQCAAHLLDEHGVLAAMKGAYPGDELERLPEGFRLRTVERLSVPGLNAERHLVLLERATT